jgi:threonyl-tRNA synthetase
VQAVIIPIAERHQDYARKVMERLKADDVRVEIDDRNEKMGYKIRAAQTNKIPFMLIVGDREVESEQVSVRNRFQGDQGSQALEDFLDNLKGFIRDRAVAP